MEFKEKRNVIKHIKLGTDEVLYYPYEGNQTLPLRPISSYEQDDCYYKALENAPTKIADFLVKLKLGLIDKDRKVNLSNEGYSNLQKFYDTIDYWTVFHAMKDFQDETFKQPDFMREGGFPSGLYQVQRMTDVHEIALFVLNSCFRKQEIIKEIFEDEEGRDVAYFLYIFNQPLNKIGELTKLQRSYIIYSKNKLPRVMSGKKLEKRLSLSGESMTMKELMEEFGIDVSGRSND